MAFQDGSLFNALLLPVQRMHLIQVDSVQRWMDDLKMMTECECMCILQSKPISIEEDSQSDLMLSSQDSTQNSLEMLLKRAWIISTELTKIVQKLEKNRWKRVHSMTLRTNCRVRSMINEYNTFTRASSEEMHQYETFLIDKCSELTEITARCTQTDDENVLSSLKLGINETLTSVGQYFSQLLNIALTQEIKNLIEQLDTCDNIYSMDTAIHSLFSLTQEGNRLCHLVAQEISSLAERTSSLESKLNDTITRQSLMNAELKELKSHLLDIKDKQENTENRDCRINLRIRGIPESITDIEGFMGNWLASALPDSTRESLTLERCHRALRSRPQPGDRPMAVVLRFHYFKTKEAFNTVMKGSRDLKFQNVPLQEYADLAPSTLAKRRDLRELTLKLRDHNIKYR
ncbi:protein inscuteable homolog [Ascaphus truei]|uniref:protein inscuteable homolog n=1 Tax=Ascaphus truei TaxID=8439 RepID=UPI003F596935